MTEQGSTGGHEHNRLPLAIVVAALILGIAIFASAWVIAHPDAPTRCADSGGSWLADVGTCWYPQSSQPIVVPEPVGGAAPPAGVPTPVRSPLPAVED